MITQASRGNQSRTSRAFSLVELVMVVTIIGVIAAIAVPRISQAGQRANRNSLQATLTNVRKSIDVYFAEHGQYPGYNPTNGSADGVFFVDQLTMYTDAKGNTSGTLADPFLFGPYLRPPFPQNPINNLSTVTVKATPGTADPGVGTVGWVAVLSHGYFGISAANADLDKVGVIDAAAKGSMRGLGAN